MWKRLKGSEYCLVVDNLTDVFVTNYMRIWHLKFSKESFLSCLKESNIGLEMEDNQLVEKGRILLNSPDTLKSVFHKEESDSLTLTLSRSFGYLLKLKFKMSEGSKELFFSKVTMPLLKTVHDLRASQRELRDELCKKDLEIEEYKCEGGEIALRFLKTEPFNDKRHAARHAAYSAMFGEADLPAWLLDRAVAAPEERPVKTEPTLVQVRSTNNKEQAAPKDRPVKAEPPLQMKEESPEEGDLQTPQEPPGDSRSCLGGGAQVAGAPAQAAGRPRLRPATAGGGPGKRNKLNL